MLRKLTPACLAVALGSGMIAGCQSGPAHHCYSDDPVLLSRTPVDGKPDSSAPTLVAHAEPAEPTMPPTAVAKAPSPSVPPTAVPAPSLLSIPMPPLETKPQESGAVAAAPRSDFVPAGSISAITTSRRRVDGNYGRAADYTWLQGVLDKHYLGYLTLRYCDYSADDRWGGKVVLEEDPRLAQFHDGDVVQVEGDLIAPSTATADQPWQHYPRYRIRGIELIKRAGD
jgi:hypothetical protein